MFAAINSFLTRAVSGYFLNKSLRFRSSASAYLSRTPATATNQTTWTWSAWIKRGILGTYPELFTAGVRTSPNPEFTITFEADALRCYPFNGSSSVFDVKSTALYRDPAAWYHVVVAFDTTQATAADRVKFYVNGQQITSFATASYPAQNSTWPINSTTPHQISGSTFAAQQYFDGEMAEVNFVDGQALAPTAFGAYSIYNQWLPKKYAGTYGTNGFYLPFNATSATSYAGSFNGSSQYLSVAKNAAFEPSAAQPWTVEAWVYPTSVTDAQVYFYGNPAVATGNDIGVYAQLGNGSTYINGGFYNGTTQYFVSTSILAPLNTWTHIAVVSTGSVLTVYGNGVSGGSVSTSLAPNAPATATAKIGYFETATPRYFPGQISNVRFVKGTAVYTANFIPPTAPLTAVTNTSLLTLQNATIVDNSTNAFTITNTGTVVTSVRSPFLNSTVLTADSSGNANNWTPNNISLTAGSTYDSLTDVPTLTSTTVANYAVLNPLAKTSAMVLSNANLTYTANATSYANTNATIQMPATGKWYFEAYINTLAIYSLNPAQYDNIKIGISGSDGLYSIDATDSSGFANYSISTPLSAPYDPAGLGASNSGDTMMVAYDAATGKLWLGAKGSWSGGGNPSTNTTPTYTTIGTAGTYFPRAVVFENSVGSANFGQRPFTYTAPTGFLPLNTFNI